MINKNETLNWEDIGNKIIIDERIKDYRKPIRGIYGIFIGSKKEQTEICAYVGRSSNIYIRMFCGGHITKLKSNYNEYPISKIKDAMDNDDEIIIVKILQEVPLCGDNYNKDMQRLSSAESYFIDYFQSKDECLEQVPEGTRMTEDEWNRLFEK